MKTNNFWGMSRSTGMNVGLIVRVGLATLSLVGSLALAWTLLSPHQGAHASPSAPSPITTSTPSRDFREVNRPRYDQELTVFTHCSGGQLSAIS